MSDVMTSAESSRSAMTFPDILAPASIRMDVEATCRREVLSLLAKILAQQTSASAEDICTALHERERLGSTALGNGLAVPHANVPGVSGCHAAMVVLREPVRFAADDERPVSVAVALISAEGRCDPRQLSSIARTFREPEAASELKRLASAEAVHAHLVALFSAIAA
jgi:nitrogen PTS system EIIA component